MTRFLEESLSLREGKDHKYAGMVDRLLLGSSDIMSYGFKSRYLYIRVKSLFLFPHPAKLDLGIASSRVEHYTSDIGILVRFQCDATTDIV